MKKKNLESQLQKQTMDLTFNTQSSQLLTLSSPPDKIFSGTRPKSACDKFPVVNFRSQPREI